MEEIFGRWWHNAITRLANHRHPEAEVRLEEVQKSIGILFRAAGGSHALRMAAATEQVRGGYRNMLQRIAGSGRRADTAQLEPDVLALPATLAVFAQRELNHDLYLWLSLHAACFVPSGHWLHDNVEATRTALALFPGFSPRYQRLCQAQMALRGHPGRLYGAQQHAETRVQAALQGQDVDEDVDPAAVAPVWIWVSARATQPLHASPAANEADSSERQNQVEDGKRRRTRQVKEDDRSNPFVLPFRAESLMTWSELIKVNRATDDDEDGNALTAANDMDTLAVAPDGATLAARVKFDLDLPSASVDDRPLGPGLRLPEWDYRLGKLLPDYCAAQTVTNDTAVAFTPNPALRNTSRQLRRRLEVLRDVPRPLHGQESGDAIDLDAWVRYATDEVAHRGPRTDTPAVYTRQARSERSLATLLLADLSLSTDAYAANDQRVIDVIRDALFVFGEGLQATGDAFAMWGFSSVRRHHVRLNHLKRFDDAWNAQARNRVGAIKPGYYTRMGAAIRFATRELQERPERRKLLMLLTDGKPNDLDHYEGRHGIEDTRQAIHEAHGMGLTPFCVTIDESGHDYLPYLFGRQGYALVHRPADLVTRLTQAWATLAH
ncbi:VWA domain-containing protein [Curvibacter sp. APW13]|uniref:nitric oxide reductase activation protein NorD n=1 Tax=Curvibacter sp. APW13 TaxID=3077236 RepID=UPI0028E0169D|nr:VWA domain-containing protein [Curvibacter sp. APW13]MDT8991895.1 VWA domain-containing protein [Curvibacter sp. APW13]